MKKPDPFMVDDDSPLWTEEDFKNAKPLRDFDPEFVEAMLSLGKAGRPPKEDRLEMFSIRLPLADIEKLRAKGTEATREVLHQFAES